MRASRRRKSRGCDVTHATLKLTDCPEGLNMEVFYEGGTIIDAMAAFGESIDRCEENAEQERARLRGVAVACGVSPEQADQLMTTAAENRAQFDKLMATDRRGAAQVYPTGAAGERWVERNIAKVLELAAPSDAGEDLKG
jgi:hypothetical protein